MIPQKDKHGRKGLRREDLRKIPPVNEVVALCEQQRWSGAYDRGDIVWAVRAELSEVRTSLRDGKASPPDSDDLTGRVYRRLSAVRRPSLCKVINASGVVVHTNLGRAPLSAEALAWIQNIAGGYSNLEFDLEKGERGSRDVHVEQFLTRLLPAEAALVVNNNASALLLILNTLAEGKEVLVSRGELIEIGGSFRLPEIMKKSGAILREVGTTNKTRASDFRNTINENTAMILSVHPSNYQIIGFTQKPAIQELIEIGQSHGVAVVEDHGSGILIDLKQHGIEDEPTAAERLAHGLDLICFSGDKILGGPQSGIICGKKQWIQRLHDNPLFRALRVDKMTYAALGATLVHYVSNRTESIPVIRALQQKPKELERRATTWVTQLSRLIPSEKWTVEATLNYLGGGVAPMKGLASYAVCLRPSATTCEAVSSSLRQAQPPVVCRIAEDKVYFELRTISEEEQKTISLALQTILSR